MSDSSNETPIYGGRALYRGVLMVGPKAMAVAIRADDGSVATAVEELHMPFQWARKIPFLRGLLSLAGAAVLAVRSASLEKRLTGGRGRGRQWLSLAAPVIAGSVLERLVGAFLKSRRRPDSPERGPGILSVILPLLAFRLAGLFGPGRQLLRYHAAEHKAVNAAEAGVPVTPESAQTQPRIHPRCGTTFAVWALLLSSILTGGKRGGMLRSLLIGPVIISLAYEIVRLAAANRDRPWAKVVYGPSWQAQRLTTTEPSTEHLEVACAALQAVMAAETGEAPAPTAIV